MVNNNNVSESERILLNDILQIITLTCLLIVDSSGGAFENILKITKLVSKVMLDSKYKNDILEYAIKIL
jgi:hypothetical protein